MAEFARVDSIDALKSLRTGLLKFIEAAEQAIVEADIEIDRTLEWVCGEQAAYWRSQVHQRGEDVRSAAQAVANKRMLPTASGLPASTVDEEAALAVARRRLEEAEHKARAVKVWARRIEKERSPYKASMGPIRGLIDHDLPKAVRELDEMLESLDAYLALEAPRAEGAAEGVALRGAGGSDADDADTPARPGDSSQDRDHESEDQHG